MALPVPLVLTVQTRSADEDAMIAQSAMNHISGAVVDADAAKKQTLEWDLKSHILEALGDYIVGNEPGSELTDWLRDIAVEMVDGVGANPVTDQYTITLTVAKV